MRPTVTAPCKLILAKQACHTGHQHITELKHNPANCACNAARACSLPASARLLCCQLVWLRLRCCVPIGKVVAVLQNLTSKLFTHLPTQHPNSTYVTSSGTQQTAHRQCLKPMHAAHLPLRGSFPASLCGCAAAAASQSTGWWLCSRTSHRLKSNLLRMALP
jgi:hypothetical protein